MAVKIQKKKVSQIVTCDGVFKYFCCSSSINENSDDNWILNPSKYLWSQWKYVIEYGLG